MRTIGILMLAVGSLYGQFEHGSDVGTVEHNGRFEHQDSAFRVTGSGANMWATTDGFYFVWTRAAGDISLTTDVAWTTGGGNAHRKAGPILRAGLASDDPYADLVAHGDGLIAMQYRTTKGGPTLEVRTPLKAPARLRIERHGSVISAEVAPNGGAFQPVGAFSLALPETVYAGLAVCSHDPAASETAVFSNLTYRNPGIVAEKTRVVESTLEVIDVATGERRIVHRERAHFEAPNWSRDGRYLIYNGGGKLYRIGIEGGTSRANRLRCCAPQQ